MSGNVFCAGCRFFVPAFKEESKGYCHRRAPQPVDYRLYRFLSERTEDVLSESTTWPIVFHEDWCGEFEGGPQREPD